MKTSEKYRSNESKLEKTGFLHQIFLKTGGILSYIMKGVKWVILWFINILLKIYTCTSEYIYIF